MDRFIDTNSNYTKRINKHLKSNMDRFIVSANFFALLFKSYLKSNMDRFIVTNPCNDEISYKRFKIQYG